MEKHVSLTIGRLAFKDSFQFLEFSLEQLAKSCPDFPILKTHIPMKNELLLRKGVYCYDYASSWSRLNETKLPHRKHFFNKLNDKHILKSEYVYALKIWKEFN